MDPFIFAQSHINTYLYSKNEKKYQATEQCIGKATPPFCVLLPDLQWFVSQIKYCAHKTTWNSDFIFLFFQHWLEEYEKEENRTFYLIPLLLIIIYTATSFRTLPLFLGHSEYWVLFLWYVLLVSQKNSNLQMGRTCYVKINSLVKLQLAPPFSNIQAHNLTREPRPGFLSQ